MPATNPIAANKAHKLLEEAYDLRVKDLFKSRELAQEALVISEGLKDQDLIGKCLNHLALFEMILGEYEQSIATARKAIKCFSALNNERGIADATYSIAGVQYKTDNFHQGLMSLMDCLVIYRKYNDYHNQSRVLKSMGTIYEYFGDQKRAIEVYEEAVHAGEMIGDKNLQSNAFNPLSGILLDIGEVKKSMEMIQKSVEMKEETGDIRGLAFSLYGRGKVFTQLKEYLKAEQDFLKSIEIHEKMGEKLGQAMTRRKLGILYRKMNQVEKAKIEFHKALELSKTYNMALIKFKVCYELFGIAKDEGHKDEAIRYLEKYIAEKETVINVKALKIIESYETIGRMETLEREAKIQKEKAQIIEHKNQDLDAFFYRISHDLKGPITSLIGLDYRVRDEISDTKVLRYMDEFKTQVYRMNNILDELIKITRLDHEDTEKRVIDFKKMIEECIQSFQYAPNFSKIKFEVQVEDAINFAGEWSLINTILQNLIENAIKYSNYDQSTPSISIKVRQSAKLEILIKDNGVGIPDEVQTRMFQMFYRGQSHLPGSGLGLYILKRAVEKINGEIKVHSKVGEGSIFHILLPIH